MIRSKSSFVNVKENAMSLNLLFATILIISELAVDSNLIIGARRLDFKVIRVFINDFLICFLSFLDLAFGLGVALGSLGGGSLLALGNAVLGRSCRDFRLS